VLINCAGTSIAGEFDSIDSAEFSRMININVLGSIFPTRAVVAEMKARKSGRIVFVSSQVTHPSPSNLTSVDRSLRLPSMATPPMLPPNGPSEDLLKLCKWNLDPTTSLSLSPILQTPTPRATRWRCNLNQRSQRSSVRRELSSPQRRSPPTLLSTLTVATTASAPDLMAGC
jgi:hypothetical protein